MIGVVCASHKRRQKVQRKIYIPFKIVTVELFRDSAREPAITRTDASSNHTQGSGRRNHTPEGHGVQTAQVSPPLVRKSDNRLPVNRSH